jgi:hypothetical protein
MPIQNYNSNTIPYPKTSYCLRLFIVSGDNNCPSIEGRWISPRFPVEIERSLHRQGLSPQKKKGRIEGFYRRRIRFDVLLSSSVFNAVVKSIVISASKPNQEWFLDAMDDHGAKVDRTVG